MQVLKNVPQPIGLTCTHVAATSSASVVDNVTIGCFLEDYEIAPEPSMKTYPEVLFLSFKSPA